MSSWSRRRKSIYAGTVVAAIIVAVGIPGFLYFYKAPTCFDGVQNGSEQGIDCGGACQKLCQSSFLTPNVAWARFEEVAPHLYNIAAYIINPNVTGEADNVPYHLALYDDKGILITDTNGTVTLPPHRNTLAFQGAVSTGKRIPAKALFEFTAPPVWYKQADTLQNLTIKDKKFDDDAEGTSLVVTLGNAGVAAIGRLSVYVALYDKDGNALGFSKTIVDQVPGKGTVLAPFTWPQSFDGKVISIEALPVAE
jgi:hypothetical protein